MNSEPNPPRPDPEEEVAHLDDRVVGRAFRWSALAFVLLAALVAGAIIYARRTRPKAAPNVTQLSAPSVAATKSAESSFTMTE